MRLLPLAASRAALRKTSKSRFATVPPACCRAACFLLVSHGRAAGGLWTSSRYLVDVREAGAAVRARHVQAPLPHGLAQGLDALGRLEDQVISVLFTSSLSSRPLNSQS
jgi:hypothetical protein